ncbi:hypothetical protein CspeluHIS016_0500780 [Cutaneotrichosporon spelunceum]|uniref:Amino acid permease/ SLC12A domain-containing protein n=1 Tax=Cutaneotrichosporon spelunceum TaxID=1672016 RepID=A0AAD3TWB8_9TREE|nr:hypothetical protein CspeluHIS016_0500780 [Cutaneotrichosporon spelunceum]
MGKPTQEKKYDADVAVSPAVELTDMAESPAHAEGGRQPHNSQVYGDDIQKGLKRGLKPRHVSLLTLGGIIGTGLFLGTGNALVKGGPVGLFLGYALYGCVLICIMQGIGEMTAFLPIPGGHLTFSGRFVDPALSFAINWAYAIQWMLVCPAELVAVAVLMNYWVPDTQINNAVWITIALVIIVILNCFPSSVYGETEFIFSSIKIITIVGLIICGIAINCGANDKHDYIGFRYWKDPGPFGVKYLGISGSTGRFLGFWAVLTQAAFSYFGAEVVAVAAAESKNPGRSIPRSIRQVYIRIFIFYVLGTFIIGLNCPSNDPRLGTTSDASASPFVIAISRAGIKVLPHIINGCLITSAWSAGNADVYIAGRSLFSLANQGYLPKWFMYTLSNGTPIVASMAAASSGLLAYMAVNANANKVFNWFVSLISVTGIMIYIGIAWTYIRFRAAVDAQGVDRSQFAFRSPFARVGAWVCIVALPIIALFSAWQVFKDTEHFDTATFITNYLPAVLVPGAYVARKFYAKTKIVPLTEVDLATGARFKADVAEELDEAPKGIGGLIHRFLF